MLNLLPNLGSTQFFFVPRWLQLLRQGGAASGGVGEVGGVRWMRDIWLWDGLMEDFLTPELQHRHCFNLLHSVCFNKDLLYFFALLAFLKSWFPTPAPSSRPSAVLPRQKTSSNQHLRPSPLPPPRCCRRSMVLASVGCHSPARCALWAPPLSKADVPFCKERFRRRNLPLRSCLPRGKSGPGGHFHQKKLNE